MITNEKGAHFRRCPDCLEIVPRRVRICPNCKAYQDWRRYVGIGQTNLALLVALISVMTAAIPVFKEYLSPQNSALTFVFQRSAQDRIGFFVSNSGIRPGSVNGATFVALTPRSSAKTLIAVATLSGPRFVEPGRIIFVEFVFSKVQHDIVVRPDTECAFLIDSTDFKGVSHIDQVPVRHCHDFAANFGH
jgi:hypothetical protein